MLNFVDNLRWKRHILLIGMALFCFFSAEKAMASVAINEIDYNPPGTDTNHEWIELWNDSDSPVDIMNWKLFEEGVNHSLASFQGSTILASDDFVVLTGSGSVFLQDHPGYTGKIIKTTFSLSNTGEQLQIKDKDGNVVDTVLYSATFANGNGMTLERNAVGLFVESLEVDGTPGDWNSVIPIPSPSATPIPTPSPSPTASSTPSPSPSPSPSASPSPNPSPSASPSVSPSPSPSSLPSPLPNVVINEFLPDPNTGESEWIELYNGGTSDVDLSTIKITDTTNVPKTLSGSILVGGYKILEPSPISLNNTGDTITLLTGTGAILDQVIYTGSTKGKTIGRFPSAAADSTGSGSLVTFGTPTKGVKNAINNHAPTAVITIQSPFKTSGAAPFSLNTTGENSIDPDHDALTFFWEYGDGTNSTSENPGLHKYDRVGTYILRLTVTDPFGFSSTTEQTIIVTAAAVSGGGGGGASGSAPSNSVSCSSQNSTWKIIIDAILPNPKGSDSTGEFIELKNLEDHEVNLCGWSIDDGNDGSKPYLITKDLIISKGGTFRIYSSESKIALNNDKDRARLFNPSSGLADDVAYEDAPEGETYELIDGIWKWSDTVTEEVKTPEVEKPTVQSTVRINEIFPNPPGKDGDQEFIELYNDGDTEVSLLGWKITGKGGSYTLGHALSDKRSALSSGNPSFSKMVADRAAGSFASRAPASNGASITIAPHSYLLISAKELGFALHNSDEKLELLDANGQLVQSVTYQDAPEGKSFNFENGKKDLMWSDVTPGKENSNTIPAVDVDFSVELYQGKQMLFLRGKTFPDADVELRIYGVDEDFTDDLVEPTLELRAQSSQKVGSYSIGIKKVLENGTYRIVAHVSDGTGKQISDADYTLTIQEGATQYVRKAPAKRASTRKKASTSSSAKKAETAKLRRAEQSRTAYAQDSTGSGSLLPFVDDVLAAGGPSAPETPTSQLPYIYTALILFILSGVGSIFYTKK